jgi:hypothetical protein
MSTLLSGPPSASLRRVSTVRRCLDTSRWCKQDRRGQRLPRMSLGAVAGHSPEGLIPEMNRKSNGVGGAESGEDAPTRADHGGRIDIKS